MIFKWNVQSRRIILPELYQQFRTFLLHASTIRQNNFMELLTEKMGEFCEREVIKGIIKICYTLSSNQFSLLLLYLGFSWLFGSLYSNRTAGLDSIFILFLKIMSPNRYLKKQNKTKKSTTTHKSKITGSKKGIIR